jgi:transcriptional regulator with XRE-family HTH domain
MQSACNRTLHKRIWAIMVHVKRYQSCGPSRLARDAGVARSTVTRFLSGKSTPSVYMILALLNEIEKQLGRNIDLRELISVDGKYPTASVCKLMGCTGCLPPEAHNSDCTTRPEYAHMKGGEWSVITADTADIAESGQLAVFSDQPQKHSLLLSTNHAKEVP